MPAEGTTHRHVSREIRSHEHDLVGRFLAACPPYETLLMRSAHAAHQAGTFPGWWYGCIRDDGELRALMCVEGTSASLYGLDAGAIDAMAGDLLRSQGRYGSSVSHRHQLLGEERVMERFWSTFRQVGRQVVLDRTRPLVACGAQRAPAASARVTCAPAAAGDSGLIRELCAEQTLESWGVDPRIASREAHERRCDEVIAALRQHIVREGARPVLIAEVAPLGTSVEGAAVMLDRVFVPRPFRARKTLVANALAALLSLPALVGREVIFFADSPDLCEAAVKAGFERRCTYRVIAMRG